MALKGRSRKCSQPSSCNETWRSWKQYYQLNFQSQNNLSLLDLLHPLRVVD